MASLLRSYQRFGRMSNPVSSLAKNASTSAFQTKLAKYATAKKNGKEVELECPVFDKILIANRGEIACRVINTAKKMGIKTVAVYSEADENSLHVKMADEAFLIGPPAARESYLRGDKILEVAKRTGAKAIHPGYGFLSENAKFTQMCDEAGVNFIGPPIRAITAMGSKSESKKIMIDAGVPVVPGYHGENQSEEFLAAQAEKIGYPLLIKAVLGGGGKGMRIVRNQAEFLENLRSARREAMSSFNDDAVLLERYLEKPRHVEFQIFADKQGNTVYLYERDCSVQRRHQKVLEEAPAPLLDPELRRKMGESAVAAAKAVGYVGAGTVEFMLDTVDNSYYFMEMNTRLQVEHPVTEMVVGQDLVEWQIKVAAGYDLPLKQDEIKLNGHAFEARIYAENPKKNFLPGTGKLIRLRTPQPVPDRVRIETGVREGDEVSIHYDPMIAKLVVWGENRDDALNRLKIALDSYQIVGLTTNLDFLGRLATHPAFKKGDIDTNFIKKHETELLPAEDAINPHRFVLGAFALLAKEQQSINEQRTQNSEDKYNPWNTLIGTRFNTHQTKKILFVDHADKDIAVEVHYTQRSPEGHYVIKYGEHSYHVKGSLSGDEMTCFIDDVRYKVSAFIRPEDNTVHIFAESPQNGVGSFHLNVRTVAYDEASMAAGAKGSLFSPMPGKIVKVLVENGQKVKKGQPLIIMEAMKMEHTISATIDGIVETLKYKPGDMVKEKQVLVGLAPLPQQ